MDDSNVFAVLTAYDQTGMGSSAFQLPENKKWPPKGNDDVPEPPILSSPEASPTEGQQSNSEQSGAIDRLIITLDVKMNDYLHGIQFGRDPSTSDVLLCRPTAFGISKRHFSIIVDDELRIRLEHLYSKYGTAVGCGGQNVREWRKCETWILACPPGNGNLYQDITIHAGQLVMKIEFPNHAIASPQYVQNLGAFSKKCQEARTRRELQDSETDILSREGNSIAAPPSDTRYLAIVAPSKAPDPRARLVYYDHKMIGRDTSRSVLGVIRTRDGKYLAAKIFRPPRAPDAVVPIRGIEVSWLIKLRQKFTTMKDSSHVSPSEYYRFHHGANHDQTA